MNKHREYYESYNILPEDTDWALRNGYRLEGGIWKRSEKVSREELMDTVWVVSGKIITLGCVVIALGLIGIIIVNL